MSCLAWCLSLSVTPVLRYSILAGIMGPWCKAISDWFIDLWPGSVLIHINVMTLPGWEAATAHLQILIVFIKKLWENVGQNMTTKEYWIFVFLITDLILSIKEMLEEKRRIWEGEGWPAWSWIPTFQTIKMPTQSIMSHSSCWVSPS